MTGWLQLDVALTRHDGDPSASVRALFSTVAPLVAGARTAGALDVFFFQRKPPDVRLRLGGPGVEVTGPADVGPRLGAALDGLVDAGAIERWHPGRYEPEFRKLGGSGAADAAHRHFDTDTRVWLAFQRLDDPTGDPTGDPGAGPVTVPSAATVQAAATNELFVTVLGDRDEVWDTWCNLADLAAPAGDLPPGFQAAGGALTSLAPLGAVVGDPRVVAALDTFPADHEAYADALNAEAREGRLLTGRRAVLPFVAQYDLQRWGLPGPAQAAIATAMATAWDPRVLLRGGS